MAPRPPIQALSAEQTVNDIQMHWMTNHQEAAMARKKPAWKHLNMRKQRGLRVPTSRKPRNGIALQSGDRVPVQVGTLFTA